MRATPFLALVVGAALATGSCHEEGFLDPPQFSTRFTTVELTDDPFPYDSVARVDLYIVRIDVSEQPDTNPFSPSWRTIAAPNQRYDLVALTGGATDTLGGTEIPAGTYRAVRMVIDTDSSSVTARSGQPMPVDWQSSALNPMLYALVEDPIGVSDSGAQIVIDFDVGRSFLCDAPCSSFVFSPVFRAVNKAATGTVSGRVRGDTLAVSPEPISDVTVTVYSGDPAFEPGWYVRATGKTDGAGFFRVAYLLPGAYILRADAPRGSPFTPGVLSNVVVERGVEIPNRDIVLPRRANRSIRLSPMPAQLPVGQLVHVTAQVVDSAGQPQPVTTVRWASLDTAAARVYPDTDQVTGAFLLGVAPGTARIQVTADHLTAVVSIPVVATTPGPIASITLAPPSATLHVADTLAVAGTARDSLGRTVPSGFTWSSSDTTVLRVTAVGFSGTWAIVRGAAAGTATLRASAGNVTGSATITVTP